MAERPIVHCSEEMLFLHSSFNSALDIHLYYKYIRLININSEIPSRFIPFIYSWFYIAEYR